jgi:uncharacterized membrane protein YqjE
MSAETYDTRTYGTTAGYDIDLTGPADGHEAGDDRSLSDLIGSLTSDISDLMSTQMQLAVVEIKEEVRQTGKAAGLFGGGAAAGYLAVALLAFAAAWGLAEVIPAGFAFLIVGLVFAAAAAVLAMQGKKVIQQTEAVPPQTKQSLKEDVQWLKQQRS